jgi:hypothetical protein
MWIVKRNVHRRPWIVLGGLFLAISGCAPGPGGAGNPVNSAADGRPVLLIVTNHYNSPMQVYARGSGFSYRMGTVLPGLVGHFVVRQAMIANGPLEFVAQANNRQQPIQSERLLLVPGDVVDFEIANSPINSIVTVRP